jgi:hypothetical protein
MFLVRSLELAGSICILAGKEGYSDLDFFLVVLYNRLQQRRKVVGFFRVFRGGYLRAKLTHQPVAVHKVTPVWEIFLQSEDSLDGHSE